MALDLNEYDRLILAIVDQAIQDAANGHQPDCVKTDAQEWLAYIGIPILVLYGLIDGDFEANYCIMD